MAKIELGESSLPTGPNTGDVIHKSKRRRMFFLFGLGLALCGAGYIAYDILYASHHIVTDNAYVDADVAQITPLIGGPVKEVMVDDTREVKRGDVLVRLDDTDARITVARTEAQLATTMRHIRSTIAADSGLRAQIAAREADEAQANAKLSAAQGDLAKAQIDLRRREVLEASGSVSGDEVTVVRNAFITARANLKVVEATQALATANRQSAIDTHAANNALISDTTVEDHPDVRAARATYEQAKVDLERTVIYAPVDGIVSRRQVQVGQRVQAGEMLMVVVPVQEAYVDANYKEVQLTKVRVGQSATLFSDLYGSGVKYHGKVVGFSGGTGAAFAIVPAQNATGNWIKVVQRLPVRIALDPRELAAHPLWVGLSITVDITVGN